MEKLFLDKKFWMAVITLVVLLIAAFHPAFTLLVEETASLAIVAVAYILGVTLDIGAAPGWRGIIQSRKFWAAVIGIVFIVLRACNIQVAEAFTPELLVTIAVVLGGYIVGVSVEMKPQNG